MLSFSQPPTTELDHRGGECMYAQIDALRAAGPAVPVELPEGVRAWSITRGDVVKRLLTDPAVSRNLKKNVPTYVPGEIPWLSPWVDVESMFTAEGRNHQRLRKLVAPSLTPKRIDAMRPQLESVVDRLLDNLESLPADEPMDLHVAFSQQVPTELICDLFGVPADQRPEVLRILRVVLNTENVPEEESAAVFEDMNVAMRVLINLKRREPGDDLTTFLLNATVDDEEPLSEQELVDMLLLMIGGGSQTTVSLIDHTVREMLARPDQLAIVLADPSRWPDAVEESLRVHCPVGHLPMRWAKEDIDLGEGVIIRKNDAILINFLAHGRDPALHENPGVFDIDRADKEHLAFGAGPHFCPGARLARLEAAGRARPLRALPQPRPRRRPRPGSPPPLLHGQRRSRPPHPPTPPSHQRRLTPLHERATQPHQCATQLHERETQLHERETRGTPRVSHSWRRVSRSWRRVARLWG